MFIDNSALVSMVNRQSSKSKRVMMLIRWMVLLFFRYNIMFKAQHIIGKEKKISRFFTSSTVSSLQTTSTRGRHVPREFTRGVSSNDVPYEVNKLLHFATAQNTQDTCRQGFRFRQALKKGQLETMTYV